MAEQVILNTCGMPSVLKFIGELLNEDKTTPLGEESAGSSVKGYGPKKDGILTCLLATEAIEASNACLRLA